MEQQQRQHNELMQATSETPGPAAAVLHIATQNNVADWEEPMNEIA